MKKILLGMMVLLVVATGCGKEQEIFGKWERMDEVGYDEYLDSETLIESGGGFGSVQREYRIEDDRLIISFFGVDSAYEYSIEDNIMSLSPYNEDSSIMYIKADTLEHDTDEANAISGEWGIESDDYEPLIVFDDEGAVSVKNFFNTDTLNTGSYIINDGLIRYEPEEEESLIFQEYLYIKYGLSGDKLQISFLNDWAMDDFTGREDVEMIELIRLDTEEKMAEREEERKAEEARLVEEYNERLSADKLNQEDIDALSSEERKKYIEENVVQFRYIETGSLDGGIYTDMRVGVKNNSTRIIDYLHYEVAFLNNVADIVDTEILTEVGPISGRGESNPYVYWDNVSYDSSIIDAGIIKVTIEYSDGDVLAINGNDVAWAEENETEIDTQEGVLSEAEEQIEDPLVNIQSFEMMDDNSLKVNIVNGSTRDVVIQDTSIKCKMLDGTYTYTYVGSLVVDEIIPAGSSTEFLAYFNSLDTGQVGAVTLIDVDGKLLDHYQFDTNLQDYLNGSYSDANEMETSEFDGGSLEDLILQMEIEKYMGSTFSEIEQNLGSNYQKYESTNGNTTMKYEDDQGYYLFYFNSQGFTSSSNPYKILVHGIDDIVNFLGIQEPKTYDALKHAIGEPSQEVDGMDYYWVYTTGQWDIEFYSFLSEQVDTVVFQRAN